MRIQRGFSCGLLALIMALSAGGALADGLPATVDPLAGLDGPTSAIFDIHDVPTIVAETEHDALFLQGYLHAKNRFFQMDTQRRAFSGTLAELMGSAAIPSDVQFRTLGLRRAAEASLAVQPPETMAWLTAYAEGVNAYINDTSQPLPFEYTVLETTRAGIPPWTTVDSLVTAKGLAAGLSFDLQDIDNTIALLTMQGTGNVLGFNGVALYFNDLFRVAPFDPTISIIPGTSPNSGDPGGPPLTEQTSDPPLDGATIPQANLNRGDGNAPPPPLPLPTELPSYLSETTLALLQSYRQEIEGIPFLERALRPRDSETGSNWFLAAGAITDTGQAMMAHDPHLALDAPATFYQNHLIVPGSLNVTGTAFPGAPGVVLGCNLSLCWGATVNPMDVTDVYQEILVANPVPFLPPGTPTHSKFRGQQEQLLIIPQTFNVNILNGVPDIVVNAGVPSDQGGVTFVVPRRNFGPIVSIDFSGFPVIEAFSVAYTGWGPTTELEAFRQIAKAASVSDFKDALQFFDVGSQNFGVVTTAGEIAYFTSGELPIREDLQLNGSPDGITGPNLIRNGEGVLQHEWLPIANPQPHQSLGTEILPFDEMPQIENPTNGYILNANNDPVGTTTDNMPYNQYRPGPTPQFFNNGNGALYLSSGYASGYRIGRMQQLFDDALAGGGTVSLQELQEFQANNQLLDAEVLVPHLLTSFDNAQLPGAHPTLAALASDPRVIEAIGRLATWDFSTPTGIQEGYDPFDDFDNLPVPSQAEIDASVAATIYSVWRGQAVQATLDANLIPRGMGGVLPGSAQSMTAFRFLLENFPFFQGYGFSGLNFFFVPGVSDQAAARDIIMINALGSALTLLASAEFDPAFAGSTDQDDYRWGKLHRITLDHLIGSPFSVPPAGTIPDLGPGLSGISRAGGLGAVDASAHDARADELDEFKFGSGPARRALVEMTATCPEFQEVIPGGQSGQFGSPFQTDQLELWLVNDFHSLPVKLVDAENEGVREEFYTNEPPVVVCVDPTVANDAGECSAAVSCDAIAVCSDRENQSLTQTCDPTGPYAVGSQGVTVECSDGVHTVSASCTVTVEDTEPPTIAVDLDPDTLWPPNHRMVDVVASVTALDNCGPPTVVLTSLTSNEVDNGQGDGNTVNDIQDANVGTADFQFRLRAERAGGGNGRIYTATYGVTDGSGNAVSGSGFAVVPHNQGGKTEPVELVLKKYTTGAVISWSDVPDAQSYNVIRGDLASIMESSVVIDLGTVSCIEAASPDSNTEGFPDAAVPASGEVFFYLVEFFDGTSSSYGTESADLPRAPAAGDCN